MSEEMQKVSLDELEQASGGKSHHKYKTKDDVPEAIYVNEQLPKRHNKVCECGNKETWDRLYCIWDGDHVYPGKECPKCGKRWIIDDALRK